VWSRIRRPARRASQARAREVLGHRPTPLRGSATGWLDAVQVNAEKSAGCELQRPRPVPGSAVPTPKIAVTERRKALPWPLLSAVSEITLRKLNDQGAPPGAPSPLIFLRGEKSKSKTRSFGSRECRCVLTGAV